MHFSIKIYTDWQLSFPILCKPFLGVFRPLGERRKAREVLLALCRWHRCSCTGQGILARVIAWHTGIHEAFATESETQPSSVPGWRARNWFPWIRVLSRPHIIAQVHKTKSLPPGGEVEQAQETTNKGSLQASHLQLVGLVQVFGFNSFIRQTFKIVSLWN